MLAGPLLDAKATELWATERRCGYALLDQLQGGGRTWITGKREAGGDFSLKSLCIDYHRVAVEDRGRVTNERMIPDIEQHGLVFAVAQCGNTHNAAQVCCGIRLGDNNPKVWCCGAARGGHQKGIAAAHQTGWSMPSAAAKASSSDSIAAISASDLLAARRISRYSMGMALPLGSCHSASSWESWTKSQRPMAP